MLSEARPEPPEWFEPRLNTEENRGVRRGHWQYFNKCIPTPDLLSALKFLRDFELLKERYATALLHIGCHGPVQLESVGLIEHVKRYPYSDFPFYELTELGRAALKDLRRRTAVTALAASAEGGG